jgi:hypothetical protein
MFEQLDVALAFASIMLLLSLLVTAAVQLLISTFGIRGRNLKWAVAKLLQHCDAELDADAAVQMTEAMFRDPFLSTSTNRLLWLLDKALVMVRRDPTKPSFNFGKRPPVRMDARTLELALKKLQDSNWPDQVGDLSDNAHLQTSLERLLSPPDDEKTETDGQETAEQATENEADGGEGEAKAAKPAKTGSADASRLKAGLDDWFDVSMSASGERFKLWARWLTAAGALAIGVGLQVNAPEIWRRLATDAELRTAALANIQVLDSIYQVVETPAAAAAGATSSVERSDSILQLQVERLQGLGEDLAKAGLLEFSVPQNLAAVTDDIGGKLATVLLLSLGAPFWYAVLAGLVGLKGPAKVAGPAPADGSTESES